MKMNIERVKHLVVAVGILALGACNQSPLSMDKPAYQTKTNALLKRYSQGVSRAFTRRGFGGRGVAYDPTQSWGGQSAWGGQQQAMPWGHQNWQLPPMQQPGQGYGQEGLYGQTLIQQQIHQEANDCIEMSLMFPETEQNYDPMVATLSRCLNRIITYRNPLMTFANRNMSGGGQQAWSYLLNYRRPGGMDSFGGMDFNLLSQFAGQGYMGGGGY